MSSTLNHAKGTQGSTGGTGVRLLFGQMVDSRGHKLDFSICDKTGPQIDRGAGGTMAKLDSNSARFRSGRHT